MKEFDKYTVTLLEDSSITWQVKGRIFKKLLKIFNSLEFENIQTKKLLLNDSRGLNVQNFTGEKITCIDKMVLKTDGKIIEYKHDHNYSIENEILKTIPENLAVSVLPLLQNHS